MQAIEDQGLLPIILDHLDCLRDILICATVSKAWQKVIDNVQPAALLIPGPTWQSQDDYYMDRAGLRLALDWLQRKTKQGHLKRVEHLDLALTFGCTADCFETKESITFCNLALAVTSSWPLTHLYINGAFGICSCVPLLPPTMQCIVLFPLPDSMDEVIPLSMFERFPNLKALRIDPEETEASDCYRYSNDACFVLQSTLPALETLYLAPWVVQIANGCSFADCLPNLQKIAIHVAADEAAAVADISKLEYLGLVLHDIELDYWFRFPTLTIPSSSMLRRIKIYPPKNTRFQLNVQKDIEFEYNGLGGMTNCYGTDYKYILPDDASFSEMSWDYVY